MSHIIVLGENVSNQGTYLNYIIMKKERQGNTMRNRQHSDPNSNLITVDEAANRVNLGKITTRKKAEEAGAVLKIGKSVRIDWETFYNYLMENYRQK